MILPWMGHRGESHEAYKKVTVGQVLKDEFNRKTQEVRALSSKYRGSETA